MGALTEEMRSLIAREGLSFVATIRPDGSPNLSPKGSTIALDEDHLAFADVESPRTIRNLVENPAIEINVVDPFVRKGFRFRGTAKVLRSGSQYWEIVERFKSAGADVRGIRAVVVVAVAYAAPIAAPIYTRGAEEEGVVNHWTEYRDRLRRKTSDPGRPPSDI
jgi:predicted pyridoxine 5'-phosphate oxidase superfamily flavin-nucleotide-binding protein